MNGGPRTQGLFPVYDAQELRRRMAVCFTIGELSRLAAKLQVPETPAWSNNPQEAARDIVRHFERSGALAFLVEALREAKPLVEWPEAAAPEPVAPAAPAPTETGDRPTPLASVPAADVLASLANDAPPAPPPPVFAPAHMRRPGEPAPASSRAPASARPAPTLAQPSQDLPPIQDPMIPPSSVASPTSDALPLSRPPTASPGAAAWPGTVRPSTEAAARKSIDPRVLLAAGFAMLLTAVAFAFFLGRASSVKPPADGDTTAAPEIGPDDAPIALHATLALANSLERVARACKIDVASLRGRSLFQVAYRRCGPLPPAPPEVKQPLIDPTPDDEPDPDPTPTRPQKPVAGTKLQKVDTPDLPASPAGGGGGGTCLSRCTKSHASCTSKCGKEPTQSSMYDAYQACLGGCLKELSFCKRSCQ